MSEPYDTDPRRSGASRARQPYDAAPDAYSDPSDLPADEPRGGRRRGGPGRHGDPAEQPDHEPSDRRDDADRPEAAAEPVKDYGRAGRNVPVSILVAVGLLLVILAPLFFFKPLFLVILVAAAGLGIWEMTRALRTSGARPPLIPLLGGGVAMMCLAWFSGVDALSIGLLITVLATMVWRMGDGPAGYQRDMGAAALTMVYVPFLLGFAAPLTTPDDGQWRILATLAAVVLSDTGGFVAGVLFGKHPMAPTISPKKSWEGFAGSIVATAAGSAAILWALLDVAPWKGALFGMVVSVAAVLGDLAESLLKRDLGIKDMSNILPGHGGIMDRLDSIVFAVPTAYLLLSVLAPPA
ncbi:phosphatidate cytidylyltransferase [Catellatospora sichuanensis]|uniref:phosphatidate cytidylyltransferase n=1 Tax=Catellatospora sichuanensis TaxID=1969805 RepID=UPI001181D2AD|nr:phosphatidate cytidylyltransferase [Catellatospora sichuanensis]